MNWATDRFTNANTQKKAKILLIKTWIIHAFAYWLNIQM